jgi:hypothetical protein
MNCAAKKSAFAVEVGGGETHHIRKVQLRQGPEFSIAKKSGCGRPVFI